jgi:AcrR family transcriptional regulator
VADKLGRGARLPAAERRGALIETATRVFAERGYRRSTTAEIAAEAGVTEPILYRHFPSKVELFLACIESAWEDMQAHWSAALAEEPDGGALVETFLRAQRDLRVRKPHLIALLVQGLADSVEDPAIAEYMRMHVGRVHELMTRIFRAAQEAGAVPPDRDPEAEAWTHMGVSFVTMMAGRLGAMSKAASDELLVQRRRWLTGG